MNSNRTIFILGAGAIGFPLAVHLVNAGRAVIAVRTSRRGFPKRTVKVTVRSGADEVSALVETISLSELRRLDGTMVIAAKSYANEGIAQALKDRAATGPIVIMQNGVAVEKPFLERHLSPVYRCVLYATGQAVSEDTYTFSPITSSPVGAIEGDESGLRACVESLATDAFPFHMEANIQREIWKKAVINVAFNSICPLLEVDNGVFARDKETADLARDMIRECVTLTDRLDIGLSEGELMEQVLQISRGSSLFISTLQDIRAGRQTEMEALNLEIARIASSMQPRLFLPRVEMLGKMVLAKSRR
jgi:2-dehydropantoate 2-reductase